MRRWALVAIILLLAAACDFSHVDPQQTVVISGRALTASGQPLGNVEVHLYKEPDVGEVIIGSVLALGTLGGICLLPDAPAVCHDGHTTTTAADGSYRFTIKGSDTQGLIGDASTLDVVFTNPTGGTRGASTTLRFKVQTTKVRLPPARLWNAGLHVAEDRSPRPTFATSWSRLPAADGRDPSYSVQLLDPTHGLALWSQQASGTRARIDARILEDHSADVAATARADLHGVDAVYLSARRQGRPIAGAPPSRHHACSAVTGTKKIATFKQPLCAPTDGDFTSPARLSAANNKVVTGAVIDFGHARHISLVTARGLAGSVVVEVSSNGSAYRQVGTGSTSTLAVHLPGRPVARYVRVRSPGGLGESLLTEVSAW
jgi:hypothetical protein